MSTLVQERKWTKPHNFCNDGDPSHFSCWECDKVRVARFLERKCSLHEKKHVWGDGITEFRDMGYTVADSCGDFRIDYARRYKYLGY